MRRREEHKEMKSRAQSQEGVAAWGFGADWTSTVQYSKWRRGVGAAARRVRPAGDSAGEDVSQGGSFTESQHLLIGFLF